MKVPYDSVSLDAIYSFAFGGRYPNASAAPFHHGSREATAYQSRHGPVGSTNDRLATSRQFFARAARPSGYTADGRRLVLRLNDSSHTTLTVALQDAWYATDSIGVPIRMIPRVGARRRTDTLASAQALLRTTSFTVPDSAAIGFTASGWFLGDSAGARSAAVTAVMEVVDSASGVVVHTLDSFVVSSVFARHYRTVDTVVDLLSGTYYLTMRVDTVALSVAADSTRSRYPVIELAVPTTSGTGGKRVGRSSVASSTARLRVRPNPFSEGAEIRYAVTAPMSVRLTLDDISGRRIRTLADVPWRAPGQYSVRIASDGLATGTYLVVLEAANDRLVQTVVLSR